MALSNTNNIAWDDEIKWDSKPQMSTDGIVWDGDVNQKAQVPPEQENKVS